MKKLAELLCLKIGSFIDLLFLAFKCRFDINKREKVINRHLAAEKELSRFLRAILEDDKPLDKNTVIQFIEKAKRELDD